MKAETMKDRLRKKYMTVTLEDLIEIVKRHDARSEIPVLYFKVIIDSEFSVTTHESLEVSK